ncbi:MAG: hypothetical protein HY775_05415 [Acidobacteria bacterium]|nr:hypothetical protein [Acidobacteriota bacterium]
MNVSEAFVLLPLVVYLAFFVFVVTLAVRAVRSLESISYSLDRMVRKEDRQV